MGTIDGLESCVAPTLHEANLETGNGLPWSNYLLVDARFRPDVFRQRG